MWVISLHFYKNTSHYVVITVLQTDKTKVLAYKGLVMSGPGEREIHETIPYSSRVGTFWKTLCLS